MQTPSQAQVQMQGQFNPVAGQMTGGQSPSYSSFPPQTAGALGVTQVVLGSLCIAFQIAAICLDAPAANVGAGIWAGVLFIIAGSFGIAASSWRNKCLIVTSMVMSIISAVFTIAIIAFSSIGLSYNVECRYDYDSFNYDYMPRYCNNREAYIAMNSVLIALTLLEVIASIWSACICCKSVACCAGPGTNNVTFIPMMVNGGSNGTPQVVLMPAGHQMVSQAAYPTYCNYGMQMAPQPAFIMPQGNGQQAIAPPQQMPQLAGSPPAYYSVPMATNVPAQTVPVQTAPQPVAQGSVAVQIPGLVTPTEAQKP